MPMQWSKPPNQAFPELTKAYIAAIRRGVRALADRYAPEIEGWMKDNAIWTDRTGNARQTLHTEVEQLSLDMVQIILAHGVEYGIFLELAGAGAYAIITPAIDYFAPRVMADVRAMLA